MKPIFLFLITTVIIFFIYLGMAYITMMPRSNDAIETDNATDITYIKPIKNTPLKQLKTFSENTKPIPPVRINEFKTQQFTDISKEQIKLVNPIARSELIPHASTNMPNDFSDSIKQNPLDSMVIKPLMPYEAYHNNINGWVLLKLYVIKSGTVFDVEVLDSSPKGVFENMAVMDAYKKVLPIKETNLDPKKHTRNIKIKYNTTDQYL